MKVRLAFLAYSMVFFVGSFFCLASRAQVLTKVQAELVLGAEPDKKCHTPATCRDYNDQPHTPFQHLQVDCPSGSDLCFRCTLATNPWDTCVVSVGDSCTISQTDNPCGEYRQGSCSGSTCTMEFTVDNCADAPNC